MNLNDANTADGMKWYEVWRHVWTHPGAEAFRTILREPGATPARGFIWVAGVTFIAGLITILLTNFWRSPVGGFGQFGDAFLYFYTCFAILTPVFAAIGLAISAAIYRGVASLFGGTGTWDKLVYAFAAVTAPAAILALPSSFMSQFLINPDTGDLNGLIPVCILGIFNLALGIYTLVLMVGAIDGVENVGTGKAVTIYFIPALILFALVICAVVALTLSAPGIFESLEGLP